MIKKVTWDHVSGSKNVEEFITETHPFDVKYDSNPFTGEKTKNIGFYPVGKSRRRWIPLGRNVTEIRVYNNDTDELIETMTVK